MGEWDTAYTALSGLPNAGDDLLIRDVTATPPTAGTLKRVTPGQLASFAFGTTAQTATVYVTAAGSDSNDGQSWATAFATVAHALSALPVAGGQTIGTVEVGYGTFSYSSTITVADTMSVRIRGRTPAQTYDPTNNVNSPVHATTLNYTGSADGIDVTGPVSFGVSGGPVPSGVILEDLALAGTSSAAIGINVSNTERIQLRNVAVSGFGTWGIQIAGVYWFSLDWVTCTQNGTSGASAPTGGLNISAQSGVEVNLAAFRNCVFNYNYGWGVYTSGNGAFALKFDTTDFSHALTSSAANSGSGFFGGSSQPFLFSNCWFEANALYGADGNAGNAGPATFVNSYFNGGSNQLYGIRTFGSQTLIGTTFGGHTSGWSIDNRNGNDLMWVGCAASESTAFIRSYAGTGYNFSQDVPDALAISFGTQYASYSGSYGALNSLSGSVTLKANLGNSLQLFLGGNVTASAMDRNPAGMTITFTWVQPASGGPYTYAWPSNFKFAGGSAPAASVTANYKDSVTLWCDGTNWWEQSRSIGLH